MAIRFFDINSGVEDKVIEFFFKRRRNVERHFRQVDGTFKQTQSVYI